MPAYSLSTRKIKLLRKRSRYAKTKNSRPCELLNLESVHHESVSSARNDGNLRWSPTADHTKLAVVAGGFRMLFRLKGFSSEENVASPFTLCCSSGHLKSGNEQRLQKCVNNFIQSRNGPPGFSALVKCHRRTKGKKEKRFQKIWKSFLTSRQRKQKAG